MGKAEQKFPGNGLWKGVDILLKRYGERDVIRESLWGRRHGGLIQVLDTD